ncbi:MAG: UbiA family prenyltransferase [Phycisphaerales bacterium]|nr:UbiA family prenyltransferase [Phycisphaerales bacterium]MCB9854813.1 UbiA family prenyltransferase [Phycisphaerales bacterium]MCB9863715.1 UbiA family prenyltransferase [Phycisphaerales bacterium]
MNRTKAWLELVRLPNIFTAITDVLAGYWLVSDRLVVSWRLVALCFASACLYAYGIVLNDIADIDVDRAERPDRPLPSGRIMVRSARRLLLGLAIVGIALAAIAGLDPTVESSAFPVAEFDWRPTAVAIALLAVISSYDLKTKGTILGPLNMGACRGLNLVFGMCAGWWFTTDVGLLAVGAMVLYVASLTYFGTDEVAERSRRFRLVTGAAGILLSILLLGQLVAGKTLPSGRDDGNYYLLALWLALTIHAGRMSLRAIRLPDPRNVQRAMKTFILGIIVFDAIIASSAQGWVAAIAVLSFLLPTVIAGRRLYST